MGRNYSKKNNKSGLNRTEKKEVRAMVSQPKEDKMNSASTGLIQHNSAISVGDLLHVLPRISQGVAEGQRVGNEIMAKRLTIEGLLNCNFNGAQTRSRIGVRLFVFSVKGYADASAAITNASLWIDGMLREGTNVRPFDGTPKSYFLPVNTDLITLHEERHIQLTQPFIWNTGLGPDATTIPITQSNSVKYFKMNIKCKNKKLKYSSITPGGGVDTVANNYGPLFAMGYCKLDGSAVDVFDTGVTCETLSVLRYEDA